RLAPCGLRRQIRKLGLVGILHARKHAMLSQSLCEHGSDFWSFVGIIELVAADAPADPGRRNPLRIADERDLVLEGEIARRRSPGIEMLMEPLVGRHDQGAD